MFTVGPIHLYNYDYDNKNKEHVGSEMAQKIKMLATKTDDLSSTLELTPVSCPLTSTCTQ